MKMMKHSITCLLLLLASCACAQERVPGKVRAWYSLHYRGAQMVDDEGRPVGKMVDTVYTLMMEIPSGTAQKFTADSACLGGLAWVVRAQAAVADKVLLAGGPGIEQEVYATPASGNVLIPLLVEQAGKPCSGKPLLVGRWQGKRTTWPLPTPAALPPVHYP
jgi:hypothetical protein